MESRTSCALTIKGMHLAAEECGVETERGTTHEALGKGVGDEVRGGETIAIVITIIVVIIITIIILLITSSSS